MGTFVASSLLASDLAIIPNEAGSKASVQGLARALDFIEEIRDSGNRGLEFLRVLITKVDRRTPICRDVIDQITSLVGASRLFETTIPINTDFQKSEFMGCTIFQSKPNAPGAKAYRALARELLVVLGQTPKNHDEIATLLPPVKS